MQTGTPCDDVDALLLEAVPKCRYKAKIDRFLKRLVPAGHAGVSVPRTDISPNSKTRKKILTLLLDELRLVKVVVDYSTGHHARRYALTDKAVSLLRQNRRREHYDALEAAAVPATWSRSKVRLLEPRPDLEQGLSRTGITVDRDGIKAVLTDPTVPLGEWQTCDAFFRHVVRFPEGDDVLPRLISQSPKSGQLSQRQPCLQTQPKAQRQKYFRPTAPDFVLAYVDFKSFHPAIVLFMQGRPWPEDFYAEIETPSGTTRDDVKTATLATINGVRHYETIRKYAPTISVPAFNSVLAALGGEDFVRLASQYHGRGAFGKAVRRKAASVFCEALAAAARLTPALGVPLHDGAIIPVPKTLVEGARVPALEETFRTASKRILGNCVSVTSRLL